MADDRASKLVLLFVAFAALITYPILGLFDRQEALLGAPLLYFYFFFVWLVLIWAVRHVVRQKRKP